MQTDVTRKALSRLINATLDFERVDEALLASQSAEYFTRLPQQSSNKHPKGFLGPFFFANGQPVRSHLAHVTLMQ